MGCFSQNSERYLVSWSFKVSADGCHPRHFGRLTNGTSQIAAIYHFIRWSVFRAYSAAAHRSSKISLFVLIRFSWYVSPRIGFYNSLGIPHDVKNHLLLSLEQLFSLVALYHNCKHNSLDCNKSPEVMLKIFVLSTTYVCCKVYNLHQMVAKLYYFSWSLGSIIQSIYLRVGVIR